MGKGIRNLFDKIGDLILWEHYEIIMAILIVILCALFILNFILIWGKV